MTAAVVRGPGLWGRRAGGVVALMAGACFVPGDGLTLLTVLGVLLATACGVLRHWAPIASGLLPPAERAPWRAEVRSVLDAAPDRRERRRQLRGFVAGLPACAATSWLLTLRRG